MACFDRMQISSVSLSIRSHAKTMDHVRKCFQAEYVYRSGRLLNDRNFDYPPILRLVEGQSEFKLSLH
jgi:hypothetical protein